MKRWSSLRRTDAKYRARRGTVITSKPSAASSARRASRSVCKLAARKMIATLTRISAAIKARNVVMATGLYQTPKIPRLARDFPIVIKQLHSEEQLLPGAVLVVGSAQSGAQIAEELYEARRKVYLATGRAGRPPAVSAAGTRTGGSPKRASMTGRSASCRRRRRSLPASRTSPAPRAAIPSTCTSSRAMVSPSSAVLRVSKWAS
jgi:cation diffusion facilitator CzcD-associated flavoprotein CzcO